MVVATKVGRLVRPVTFAAKTRRVIVESLKSGDVKRIGGDAVKITRRLARGRSGADVQMGYPFDQGQAAMESYYDFVRRRDALLRRASRGSGSTASTCSTSTTPTTTTTRRSRARSRPRQAAERRGRRRDRRRHEPDRDARPVRTEAPFDVFLAAGRYTLLDQQALEELIPSASGAASASSSAACTTAASSPTRRRAPRSTTRRRRAT